MRTMPVCPACDVHTHIHPDHAETMRAIMDANGIAEIVNLGWLERLDLAFDAGMRTYREAFGERMAYFTTPDFRDTSPGFGESMAADLERKVAAGARGLKIFKELGLRHCDSDGRLIAVDDPRLDPLWDMAGRLGVSVLIHTADPLAFFRPLDKDNERWDELQAHPDWHFGRPGFPDHDTLLAQRNRVLERHRGTIFIGAHLGECPESLDFVDQCFDRYPNFYADTSARIGEIGRHPAEQAAVFFVKHQERILFGSDLVLGWDAPPQGPEAREAVVERSREFYSAHWHFFETRDREIEYPGYPVQGQWHVDAIGLPDSVLSKLYRDNARRLVWR